MKKDERQLIGGLLAEDKFWLVKFHQRYEKRLFNFVCQKIDDSRDAEEIVQDTVVSVFYCLPSFSGRSSFWTWICAIAKHEMADFYRKKKLKEVLFSRFPRLARVASQALSPETALEEKEMKQKIIGCFLQLTEGYREVLRLKYMEGFSMAQIAEKLGKTVKAVEMKLRRARFAFVNNWHEQTLKQKIIFPRGERDLSFLA